MKPLWHKTPNSPLAILRGEISLQLSEALLQGFHFLKAEISSGAVGWLIGGSCFRHLNVFFWVLGGRVAEIFWFVVLYRSCSSKTSFISQILYVLLGRLRRKKAEF